MKKGYKIFFSLSFVFILAFSIFLGDFQTLFVSAGSVQSNEIVEDNSFDSKDYISRDVVGTGFDVSFISPNNDILYSTGSYIPSGSSLYDIQNSNVLLNNALLDNTNGQPSYTSSSGQINIIDNWFINNGSYVVDTKTFTGTTQWNSYFGQDLNYSSLRGQTLTLSVYITDISLANSFRLFFNDGSLHTSNNISSTGLFTYTYSISNSASRLTAGVLLSSSSSQSISFDWLKVEVGSSFTGYYNVDYINNKLSTYSFSNYYYQYDIDYSQPITSDKYFYPIKFTRQYDTWLVKNWGGRDTFSSSYVWTDGTNYYLSNFSNHYVLDVSTSTWVPKTWNINVQFTGNDIWTDGTNYYLSDGSSQYVLDLSTSTWIPKTWNGLTSFYGMYIWTDGSYYYYSYGSLGQYVLNVSTSTWTQKTWSGLSDFDGRYIWTDGFNYYYSNDLTQMVLSGSTWTQKTWSGLSILDGMYVWTDGTNYYLSNGVSNFVLDVSTSTWSEKIFNGLTRFYGRDVWYSNFGIFYSNGPAQYVLGSSLVPLDSDYYYQSGYSDGYNTGYTGGYNNGYNTGYYTGVENAGNYTFFSLISAVMDAPLKVFYGLFNFELMGVNLAGFIQALLSLAILLFIIRFALQK